MTGKSSKENQPEQKSRKVTFICQECLKTWNIGEMRRITRFRPILVMCPECETGVR